MPGIYNTMVCERGNGGGGYVLLERRFNDRQVVLCLYIRTADWIEKGISVCNIFEDFEEII